MAACGSYVFYICLDIFSLHFVKTQAVAVASGCQVGYPGPSPPPCKASRVNIFCVPQMPRRAPRPIQGPWDRSETCRTNQGSAVRIRVRSTNWDPVGRIVVMRDESEFRRTNQGLAGRIRTRGTDQDLAGGTRTSRDELQGDFKGKK